MKKILCCLLVTFAALTAFAAEKVEYVLFVSPSCVHCNKLKHEYWDSLKEKYKDTVNFTEYDLSVPENNLLFNQTAQAYGIPADKRGYPAAAVGSTYLMGYPTEIGTYSEAAIEKAQLLGEKTNVRALAQDQVQVFAIGVGRVQVSLCHARLCVCD